MESGYSTKILICADCGEEFVFTVQAQEYFAEKGYTEDPKLGKACYMLRKREKKQQGREIHEEIDVGTQNQDPP
jgi:hypothetical protein